MATKRIKSIEEVNLGWLGLAQYKERFMVEEVEEFPNRVLKAMPNPVVTVRITTYQHAKYIKRCLDGVLEQQTNFPFEIIIGDDESSDGTREICMGYARQYPDKVRLFLHKRANTRIILGKACGIFQIGYNTLAARGQYIAGCSGDDYWNDPTKLQKQVDFLRLNPNYSHCIHDWETNSEYYNNKKGPKFKLPLTLLSINVFQKLPQEFVEVLNEDSYFNFILEQLGDCGNVEDINSAFYNYHGENMWAEKTDPSSKLAFILLLNQKIFETFRSTQIHNIAKERLFDFFFNNRLNFSTQQVSETKEYFKKNQLHFAFLIYFNIRKLKMLLKKVKLKLS